MEGNGTLDAIKQSATKTAPAMGKQLIGKLRQKAGLEPDPWWKRPMFIIPAAFIGGIAFAKPIFGSKKS